MLTKELLVQRRDAYRQAWLQGIANAAYNEGAMQAIEELLAQLDAPEEAPKTPEALETKG